MPKNYNVIITPEAELDLFEIYTYIAGHSGRARAGAFVERIEAHCQALTMFPERGTQRDFLPSHLHITHYRRQATIAYIVDESRGQVAILRVFGAGQDFEKALRDSVR